MNKKIPEQDIINRFNSGCDEFVKCHQALEQKDVTLYQNTSRKCVIEIFGAFMLALENYFLDFKANCNNQTIIRDIDKLFQKNRTTVTILVLIEEYETSFGLNKALIERLKYLKEIERNVAEHDLHTPNYRHLKEAISGIYQIISNHLVSRLTNLKNVNELIDGLGEIRIDEDETANLRLDLLMNIIGTTDDILLFAKQVNYYFKIKSGNNLISLDFDIEKALKNEINRFKLDNSQDSKLKVIAFKTALHSLEGIKAEIIKKLEILLTNNIYYALNEKSDWLPTVVKYILRLTSERYESIWFGLAKEGIHPKHLQMWEQLRKDLNVDEEIINNEPSFGQIPYGSKKLDLINLSNPRFIFSIRVSEAGFDEIVKNINHADGFQLNKDTVLPFLMHPKSYDTAFLPREVIIHKVIPRLVEKLYWEAQSSPEILNEVETKYNVGYFYIALG